jgi:acetyl-CoA acetyltransferase
VTEPMERRAVISGIGRSTTGRRISTPPIELTLDACLAAIADAGLEPRDIDGLVTWPGEGFAGGAGFAGPGILTLQDALRLSLEWYASGSEGLNLLGHVLEGCMAISAGVARHVLAYRTISESSAQRGGARAGIGDAAQRVTGPLSWQLPFGARSAANWAALSAQLHFATHGTTPQQLGAIAVSQRANAARNPHAAYREPLTIDDYLSSRMISSPLRLYDCDVPADGAFAFVLSPRDYARDAPNATIAFEAVSSARTGRALWEQRADMLTMSAHDAAKRLWTRTDLRPGDVDVAQIYDGFSIFVLMWLEAAGFCAPGESGPLVQSGELAHGGRLPVNTAGGQLSEGRFVGSGLLYEACRQLRGSADERQVDGAQVAYVGIGGGNVAQALLLTRADS